MKVEKLVLSNETMVMGVLRAAERADIKLCGVPVLINRRLPVGMIVMVHGNGNFTIFQPETDPT